MFNWRKKKEARTRAMAKIASSLDLSFSEKDDERTLKLLGGFKLYMKGGRRNVGNVLSKKSEFLDEENVFDYSYVISDGNSSRKISQTVFFVKSKELKLPRYNLKPEKIFHRIGIFFGMQDIDFEEFPTFSDQYLLQGPDEDFIRATFDKRILTFLTDNSGWHIEGNNYFLIIYKHGKIIQPKSIKSFIEMARKISTYFQESADGLTP